jgi:TPP-dependent pyruvate/acetoin dehydrogenase alpha subunit
VSPPDKLLQRATFAPTQTRPYRLLDPQGVLLSGERPPMSVELAREALWWMILSRRLDEWGTRLQRMGRIGLYGPLHGQEASTVGTASVLDHGIDWLVPAYREQAAWLLHGLPLETLMAIYMGRLEAGKIPDTLKMLLRQQSVAAQLPHAVGLAWAQLLRKTGAIVMVYCGEGATSEGDFHEACNLAGVLRAPIIFVVQNNAWALSTPFAKQTASQALAARAPGYGFVGYQVDGNDLFAVNKVARMAAVRARSGEGPTLIENVTYRVGFHNTSDNPDLYRSRAEVEDAVQFDPILRVERYLSAKGAWTAKDAAETRARADEAIKAAIKVAGEQRTSEWSDVFDHAYAELPVRLARQRAALQSEVTRS